MPDAKRILILDDSANLLALTTSALKGSGYEVDTAGTLEEMSAHLKKHKPDLFLIDVVLPDLYGYDLIGYLRDVEKVNAKLILFSSMNEERLRQYVSASGADGFIQKDQGLEAFLEEVTRFLSQG